MENNFIIVQQRPTPEELLKALIQILPDFGVYWDQPDIYDRDKDGSFPIDGVFNELSYYIKKNFSSINEAERVALFGLIERCVKIKHDPDRGV